MAKLRKKSWYVHFIDYSAKKVYVDEAEQDFWINKHEYLMALVGLEKKGFITCHWLPVDENTHKDAWIRELETAEI